MGCAHGQLKSLLAYLLLFAHGFEAASMAEKRHAINH